MVDLAHNLKQDYLDLHIKHGDTHTIILFIFKHNINVDCNPTVCVCFRIFKDIQVCFWIKVMVVHMELLHSN